MIRPSSSPDAVLAKAERIFRDELRQGCGNHLVRRGLSGFVRFWVAELRQLHPGVIWHSLAQAIEFRLRDYDQLAPPERRAALESALALIASSRAGEPVERARDGGARPVRSPESAPGGEVGTHLTKARVAPIPLSRTETYQLDTPLERVKGIGPARAKALARLGLRAYGDLLRHFPSRHEHYPPPQPAAQLLFIQKASYEGVVRDVQTSVLNRGLRKVTARLADPTGLVTATWLRAGYSGVKLEPGHRIAISGNVAAFGRQIVFENPDWEPADSTPTHTRGLVPIYPLTSGIHQYWLRALIRRAVDTSAGALADFLPDAIRSRAELPALDWAVAQLHFPVDAQALALARRRLAFDELFMIQLVVQQRRKRWQEHPGVPLRAPADGVAALLAAQAFRLTGAQQRVTREILADMSQPIPMCRLLQGEVGSGKTAVAAVALFVASAAGRQSVLMAPTEILAEQHYRTLTDFYGRAEPGLLEAGFTLPRVALLTGSATRRQKEKVYLALKEGEVDILVGTQAVIQEGVEPRLLGLTIVDEQHRFGVRQRLDLRQKGGSPHLLVMTATPIPRTLALSLHGDLDLSIIDEMPPGRRKIKTHLLVASERQLAYEHIRREVRAGRQAFLICPLVEGSPHVEARAATEEYERLRQHELAGLRLALLHGRMKPAEKDDVMLRFREHEFDVLISTAVVEVGVDVPNATVMLVEGAERFGLAQLHQFRGRVGRGIHPSTCVLLTEVEDGDSHERLQMLVRSDNGLELADYDLRQRGPGDFFGVRQSGLPELRVATLDDVDLVELGRELAAAVLERDPDLSTPEHARLADQLESLVHRIGEPN